MGSTPECDGGLPVWNLEPALVSNRLPVIGGVSAAGFRRTVLKTPVRAPKANAYCERLIGTIRRECLDFLIPLNEGHLKRIVQEYVSHYNRGRPHSALGPGLPEPPQAKVPAGPHRHRLHDGCRVNSSPVLGGLHYEYWPEKKAA